MTRTLSRLAAASACGISLAAALLFSPAVALADDGQIQVDVPTEVPCTMKADGTVITPTNWEIKNVGTQDVSLEGVSVEPNDRGISLSAASTLSDRSPDNWFSYENGDFSQQKIGEVLEPSKSVRVSWSVGKLDGSKNASTIEQATKGTYTLAKVNFSFSTKRAFAVLFDNGEARLYKRSEVPKVGDSYDGKKVVALSTSVETGQGTSQLFGWQHNQDIKSVEVVDDGITPVCTNSWFYNCQNLETADMHKLDTSYTSDMSSMFRGCYSLRSLDISTWNTSSLREAVFTFWECEKITSFDVAKWDTSKLEDAHGIFEKCRAATSIDVSNWNTSSMRDMSEMFSSCQELPQIDVSNWDTSNSTNMKLMFNGCSKLPKIDVANWNVSAVKSMADMFDGCESLTSLGSGSTSRWDTSAVTNMNGMFASCEKLPDIDVSGWDTSNVTNLSKMFAWCYALTSPNVSRWDTSKVTTMSSMFLNCSQLNKLDVSGWNTSQVTDVTSMFQGCKNLTQLDTGKWNTSNIVNASSTFYGCEKLSSLDLSSWDTARFNLYREMFKDCTSLTSVTFGPTWKAGLGDTELPGILYGSDGTEYALAKVPLGVAATYYTKAEYVPKAAEAQADASTGTVPASVPDATDREEAVTSEKETQTVASPRDDNDTTSASPEASQQEADGKDGMTEDAKTPAKADGPASDQKTGQSDARELAPAA